MLKGRFCECVGFIFLNIFNQIPLPSLYIALLLRHCTSRRKGRYTDQHYIWIKKLHICHVTGTEWAQPDWIGASVCLIPAEEPWVWREQRFGCVKHHFDTHLFKKKIFLPKDWVRTVEAPIIFRHVFGCILPVGCGECCQIWILSDVQAKEQRNSKYCTNEIQVKLKF